EEPTPPPAPGTGTAPGTGADRAGLAARLRDERPAGVLSLLALDDRPHPDHPTLSRGMAAGVTLVQAAADAGLDAPLWCLTSGAVAVHDSTELTHPFQTALWGAAAALSLDHPGFWGGMVDVPATLDESLVRALCASLAGTAGGGAEDQLALRAEGRYARRLVRAPLGEAHERPSWTPRGTTLITGGTGGVGAHVARRLAREGAEHLILTSRRGPAADGMAELRDELAALGARTTVAACDVTDCEELRKLLDSVPGEQPLTAVVHAAGVPQLDTPLPDSTLAEFAEVGRAKVGGAALLDELLGDRPLDAFVLFSSGAAVWGSAGQAAYGAANAYLDALAHRRRARGLAATSVAWGPLDSGMVDEEISAFMRRTGAPAMDTGVAVGALRHAVPGDEPNPVVAEFDWSRFAPAYTLARARPLLDALPEVRAALDGDPADGSQSPSGSDSGTGPELRARLAALSAPEQRRTVLELVRTQVAAVLGYDSPADVEPRRPFTDLGFDSVSSVELRSRLNGATGLRTPATVVFDYASPDALAGYLHTELSPGDPGAGGGAAARDGEPVTAELDRFEATVTALTPDDLRDHRIVDRLRALVTRLDENQGSATPGAEVDDLLQDASADDVLAFIDKELGSA
ncbi:type I polyketide synthase, partial [Streptomyces boncukensis]